MNYGLRIKSSKLEMVKEVRKIRGFTHESLAQAVEGMSRTTVSQFLNGGYVSPALFNALCQTLKLDPVDIADLEYEEAVRTARSKHEIQQKLISTSRNSNNLPIDLKKWIYQRNFDSKWLDISEVWNVTATRYSSNYSHRTIPVPLNRQELYLILPFPNQSSEDFDLKVEVRFKETKKPLPYGLSLIILSEDNGLIYQTTSKNDTLALSAPVKVTEFSEGGNFIVHLTHQGFSFTQPVKF